MLEEMFDLYMTEQLHCVKCDMRVLLFAVAHVSIALLLNERSVFLAFGLGSYFPTNLVLGP